MKALIKPIFVLISGLALSTAFAVQGFNMSTAKTMDANQ